MQKFWIWREALRRWVNATLGTEQLRYAVNDKGELLDWVEQLKDGCVLCSLMNALVPNSVAEVNPPTAPMFMLWKNTTAVLVAADKLGIVRKNVHFTESDVFYNRKPMQVILFLTQLETQCRQIGVEVTSLESIENEVTELVEAGKLELEPLCPLCLPLYGNQEMSRIMSSRKAMQLASLRSLASSNTKSGFVRPQTGGFSRTSRLTVKSNPDGAKRRSLIQSSSHRKSASLKSSYSDNGSSIVLLQAAFRRHLEVKKCKKIEHRSKVAHEILSTEEAYVRNLDILLNTFLQPLKDGQEAIQVHHIFSEVSIILAFSRILLQEISPRIEKWHYEQKLGDIFLKNSDFMKVYAQYVKDYGLLLQLLPEVKDSTLQKILKDAMAQPSAHGLSLDSYLILPIQRIPRYEMLLREIWKRTPKDHPDYEDLSEALSRIQEIATYVNEQKRVFESLVQVIEIQKMFTGGEKISAPHRKFVKMEDLHLLPSMEVRRLYLFNDILLVCKVKGKHKLKLERFLPLGQLLLKEMPDTENSAGNFQIRNQVDGCIVNMCATSPENRKVWIDEIEKQQNNCKEAAVSRGLSQIPTATVEIFEEEEEEEDEDFLESATWAKGKEAEELKARILQEVQKEKLQPNEFQQVRRTLRATGKLNEDVAGRMLMKTLSKDFGPQTSSEDILEKFRQADNLLPEDKRVMSGTVRRKSFNKELEKNLKKGAPGKSASHRVKKSWKKGFGTLRGTFKKQGSFTTDDADDIQSRYGCQLNVQEMMSGMAKAAHSPPASGTQSKGSRRSSRLPDRKEALEVSDGGGDSRRGSRRSPRSGKEMELSPASQMTRQRSTSMV